MQKDAKKDATAFNRPSRVAGDTRGLTGAPGAWQEMRNTLTRAPEGVTLRQKLYFI